MVLFGLGSLAPVVTGLAPYPSTKGRPLGVASVQNASILYFQLLRRSVVTSGVSSKHHFYCLTTYVIIRIMRKRGRIKIRKIKTWMLLLFLVPLFFIDATLLRLDHVRMAELRTAVLEADERDDDEEIAKKMEELKSFVFSNMVINVMDDNGEQKITFGTGPFYLEHQYIRHANRALEEAEKNMKSDENPNGNIYAMASDTCRALALQNGWSWDNANYINCMVTEIQKYPAADELQDKMRASLPSTELYRHNYASPVWAPSLTGFFVLVTLIVIVVIFIRGIIWVVLELAIRFM